MTVYCDIDGTLTDSPERPNGAPRLDVIEHVKEWIAAGHDVILWSARGREYATEQAHRFGIEPLACLGKPGLIVDDKKEIRPRGRANPISPEQFMNEKCV